VKSVLQVPALAMQQGKHTIFQFAVDGKDLESFTTVSRAFRDDQWLVRGYQRPEICQHVREITEYLKSGNAMLPNSLVVGFEKDSVKFKAMKSFGLVTFGILSIPTHKDYLARCGFVVDGQQRRAAIRESGITGFPVLVSGFLAESEEERREQFILVNSTKPLPRALIFELLPVTETKLPPRFAKHKLAVVLLERLNGDRDSCLRRLVRTPTQPAGIIKDNSVLKGINNSLSDGVLHRFRSGRHALEPDVEGATAVLKDFWLAVSRVFPADWARPPAQSRLMHGAGVVGLSFIMDAISDNRYRHSPSPPAVPEFVEGLEMLKPYCCWSEGQWWFGRKYNDIQNTPKDVHLFTNHLCRRFNELLREKHERFSDSLASLGQIGMLVGAGV